MSISDNIKKYRMAIGLKQTELAAKLNVNSTYISHLERGTKVPSLPLARDMASIFGCMVDDLL